MAVAEELKVVVRAEVDKAMRDLQKFDRSLTDTGTSAKSMGMKMAAVGAAVGVAIVAFRKAAQVGRELVQAYARQEQAEARLAAVVRATGQAAGFTSDEMIRMAQGLQSVTTYGDEAIIEMQSIIGTFRSIQGDVFEKTTELALDLSAAFGQDLKSSAIQLGKALEDPATGLTALRRIGVTFSEEQQEMIKGMQEAGDVAGAQTEILKVLESQVGGVARAMANTATGQIEQFKNKFGDLKEALGQTLTEAVEPLVTGLTNLVSGMIEAVETARDLRRGVEEMEAGLNTILAYEAEIRDIDRQLKALEGNLNVQGAQQRYNALAARRLELEQLIYWTKQQQTAEDERQAEEQREAAEQAEREAAAAQRQLEIDLSYAEARANILSIMESEKTESDRIRENIEYLEGFGWADGSMLEADRLAALEILRQRLDELAVSTKNLNTSITMGGQIDRPGMVWGTDFGRGTGDSGNKTSEYLVEINKARGSVEDMAETVDETFGPDGKWVKGSKEVADITAYAAALIRAEQQAMANLQEESAELVDETFAPDGKWHKGAKVVTDEMEQQLQIAKETANEIAAVVGAIESGFGSGGEFDYQNVVAGLLNLVPVIGPLLSGIYRFMNAIGDFFRSLDKNNPNNRIKEQEEEAERLRQAEIEARREYLRELQEQFDLQFDILRDQWERNMITTDEFIQGMEDMTNEFEIESLPPWIRQLAELLGRDPADFWNFPSAATGANFVTNGPQLLRVGDNASGREHVMVNPNPGTSMGGVNISIGVVYGVDDLGIKIHEALESARGRGLIPA